MIENPIILTLSYQEKTYSNLTFPLLVPKSV